VAADTLGYVQREMTDPGGGFYSAEDADSVPPEDATAPHPHKVEGAFYVWTDEEVRELLGENAEPFVQRFGVRPGGNAPADPQGEFTGKNLLYTARSIDDIAASTGRSPSAIEETLKEARRRLFARREERPRPHLDDKILTAWNGLMVAAFARAGRILPDGQAYLSAAARAALFIRTHLWSDDTRTLKRRYRQGQAAVDGYAEDYAYLIFGLLELFQSDGDAAWLEWALRLQARQDELFWDGTEGGWFSTTGADPSVLLRLKEDYDGAEPAASSIGVLNLLTLAHLTGDASMNEKIELTLRMFGGRAARNGRTVPMALAAMSMFHAGVPQIVFVGREDEELVPFTSELRRHYLPTAAVVPVTGRRAAAVSALLPWIAAMTGRDGRPTAYVCREFSCLSPVTSAAALGEQLDKMTS
jgi:uncharacterized protein YyaL (SSP411 family)